MNPRPIFNAAAPNPQARALGEELLRLLAESSVGGKTAPLDRASCLSLIERGARLDLRNDNGWLPIHSIVTENDARLLQALLNAGCDINARTAGKNSITPLMMASVLGHAEMAKILLDRGADMDCDCNGTTAADFARANSAKTVLPLFDAARASRKEAARWRKDGMPLPAPMAVRALRLKKPGQ